MYWKNNSVLEKSTEQSFGKATEQSNWQCLTIGIEARNNFCDTRFKEKMNHLYFKMKLVN